MFLVRLATLAFILFLGFVVWTLLDREVTYLRIENLARDKPVVGTVREIYESARNGPLRATLTDVKLDCAKAQEFRREYEGGPPSRPRPQGFLVANPDRSIFVVATRYEGRPCRNIELSGVALPVRSHVRRDLGPSLPGESMELMLEAWTGRRWIRVASVVFFGGLLLFIAVAGLVTLVKKWD